MELTGIRDASRPGILGPQLIRSRRG